MARGPGESAADVTAFCRMEPPLFLDSVDVEAAPVDPGRPVGTLRPVSVRSVPSVGGADAEVQALPVGLPKASTLSTFCTVAVGEASVNSAAQVMPIIVCPSCWSEPSGARLTEVRRIL